MLSQTPGAQRLRSSICIVYASLAIQALVTFVVISFCCFQLTRPHTSNDDSKVAVYVSLLTGSLAYWFPSPASSYIAQLHDLQTKANDNALRTTPPTTRDNHKRRRPTTSEDDVV
jgi:hypothetical protein